MKDPFQFTKTHLILIAALFYVAYAAVMWKWGHQGDMEYWMTWAMHIFQNGFTNVYDQGSVNYFPAYLYIIKFHTWIQGNATDVTDNLFTLKYYTLVFDVSGALAATWLIKDINRRIFCFLLLMLNVTYVYNTAIWGQVDAIFCFWGFLSIILALEKRPVLSVLSLLIAVNFKLQAVVYFPVVGLLLLPQFLEHFKKIIIAILSVFVLQLLILAPFLLKGKAGQVIDVLTGLVGQYPYPSASAFNFWFLVMPDVDLMQMFTKSDQVKFLFLTLKQWGLLMFGVATFVSLLHFFRAYRDKYIRKQEFIISTEQVFLSAALVALSFYFFNTQMHERYAHPVLLPLAAYTFFSWNWKPLILFSIAYGLNLERINWSLHIHTETYMEHWLFGEKFIAFIYLITLAYMFCLSINSFLDRENKETDMERFFLYQVFKESKWLFAVIIFLCVVQNHFTNKEKNGFPWFYWAMYSSAENLPDYVNQYIIHIDEEPFDYLTLDYWGGIGIFRCIDQYKKIGDNAGVDPRTDYVSKKTGFFPEKIQVSILSKLLNQPSEIAQFPAWLHQYLEKKLNRKIRKVEVYNNWYRYTDKEFHFSGGGDIFIKYESDS